MITVLGELCVGCGHCVPFCSVDALSVFGLAAVDSDLCIGCQVCIEYCPNHALRWDDI